MDLFEKLRNKDCKKCSLYKTAEFVCLIGDGKVPSDIVLVGEAPGHREEEFRRPFSGRAGKLLDSILNQLKIKREDIFITNVVKCKPPGNRTPTDEEIVSCSGYLKEELKYVKPKKIILMGETAVRGVLGIKDKIARLRKKTFKLKNEDTIIAVTYHPAAALRRPFLVNILLTDLKRHLISSTLYCQEDVNYRDIELSDFDSIKSFAIDLETDGLDFMKNEILCISMSVKSRSAFFISKDKISKYKKLILKLMDDPKVRKQGHNLKFDLKFMLRNNLITEKSLPKNNFFCSMIASNIIDENYLNRNLEHLSTTFLGMNPWKTDDDFNSFEKLRRRNLIDADAHRRLYIYFKDKIKKENLFNPFKIDMNMLKVLVSAEYWGVKIDLKELNSLDSRMEKLIQKLSNEIPINPNSNKQLSEYFSKNGISGIKRTEKGEWSWSKSSLEELINRVEGKERKMVEKILEFRKYSGIKSKFLDNLRNYIGPDGKVHPNFNQVKFSEGGSKEIGTFTGRLSCRDPNLQQIPRDREDLPKEINPRKLFIPSHPDGFIITADYNQIEVRMAAHLASDTKLIDFLERGEDIHRLIASEIFGKPKDKVTKDERKAAKSVVFGILYMITPVGLAKNLNISVNEARDYIDKFFKAFPCQKDYIDEIEGSIITNHETANIFGRKRRLPGATLLTPEGRTAIRQGVNFRNQSSAVDIVKIAAFRIYSEIIEEDMKSRIFASVHDSIDLDVYPGEENKIIDIIKKNMINPRLEEFGVNLKVPLEVSIQIGKNWLEVVKI